MGKYFSDKTEKGIELVWQQFNKEKILEGQKLLQEAANEGDSEAYNFLARTYMGAPGITADDSKAENLLREGLKLKSACCILTMLQFKKLSKEVESSLSNDEIKKAADTVLKKAEDGHGYCQMMIGMYYFWGAYWRINGIDIDKEYGDEDKVLEAKIKGAYPWYEKALYNGVTVALTNLYDIYDCEQYVPNSKEELKKALEFAVKCGDIGWMPALCNFLYENAYYKESLARYKELAEMGYIRAWYDVGFQYEMGAGVDIDKKAAISAYEAGAKEGNAECQIRLGKHLLWGKIVAKDETQAYFWINKAAEQGNEVAKMFKGHCLLYGLGVKRDVDEGTTFLYDALNYNYPGSGSSQAMTEESQFDWDEDMLQMFWDLGDAYENGLGMPKRQHLAGYYFSMVAEGGWPEGIEKMTHYKEGMFGRWKKID